MGFIIETDQTTIAGFYEWEFEEKEVMLDSRKPEINKKNFEK